mmetsp:Transcript_6362/g.8962  ORF Transcript_6362/g.8962 Transcript_6362/m.8962 type:complete len:249 (-) Transcript_6362:22-768(-)
MGQSAVDRDKWAKYCLKDDAAIHSLLAYGDKEKKKITKKTVFQIILHEAKSADHALAILSQLAPDVYSTQYVKMKQNFTHIYGCRSPVYFTLNKFIAGPLPGLKEKITIIWGKSNTGKTNYALAQFKNPALVNTLDDWNIIPWDKIDGVVWDEANMSTWTPEMIKQFGNVHMERSLKVRYVDARIPPNVPIILTSNRRPTDILPGVHMLTQFDQEAIARRFNTYEIQFNLYAGNPIFPPPQPATNFCI